MRGVGIGLLLLAGVLGACTSVKIVQRDGCWIRRTERKLGGVNEEIGPCVRPEPKWADGATRVMQECMVRSDYRWQERALAAWSRGEPLPPQQHEETVVEDCMRQSGLAVENEALRKQLADASSDRDALRAGVERDRQQLHATSDRLVDYLGEAAKKSAPSAFATATSTSDGSASTENGSTLQAGAPGAPAAPSAPAIVAAPLCVPAAAAPNACPPAKAAKAKPQRHARKKPPVAVPADGGDPGQPLKVDAARPSGSDAAPCPTTPAPGAR